MRKNSNVNNLKLGFNLDNPDIWKFENSNIRNFENFVI